MSEVLSFLLYGYSFEKKNNNKKKMNNKYIQAERFVGTNLGMKENENSRRGEIDFNVQNSTVSLEREMLVVF